MRVDEFVAMTLEQIVKGIQQAQEALKDSGGRVNPQLANTIGEVRKGLDMKTHTRVQNVEFDLAVTVTESSRSETGAKVGLSIFGGGIEAGSDKQHSAANRIRFVVPVVFPKQAWKEPPAAATAADPGRDA